MRISVITLIDGYKNNGEYTPTKKNLSLHMESSYPCIPSLRHTHSFRLNPYILDRALINRKWIVMCLRKQEKGNKKKQTKTKNTNQKQINKNKQIKWSKSRLLY